MSIIGKWMYNTGNEENWNCDEGEFDTKEEAIAAGIKYFTEPDGYEEDEGEKYDADSFDVGLVAEPDLNIRAWTIIDNVTEQVSEECGEYADGWLVKVSKEEQQLLSNMMTKTLKEWLDITSNNPRFFTIKNVETVHLK